MSAQVAIVCDQCGDIGTVGPTPHDARAELKGWARKVGLDICPLCRFILEGRRRHAPVAVAQPSWHA